MKLAGRLFLGVWTALGTTLFISVALMALIFGTLATDRAPDPFVQAAAIALDTGGRAGLERWLAANKDGLPYWQVYVLDPAGRDLLGRTLPSRLRKWATGRSAEQPIAGAVRYDGGRLVPSLVDRSGARYSFVTLPPVASPFRALVFGPGRWLILLGALVSTALVSWFIASSVARPLRALTRKAESIRGGDFNGRVAPEVALRSDEIGALARGFDGMLQHVRELLASRENLLRDVSHELRSPLTRMQLAIGLSRQSGGSSAQLDRLASEAERMEQLVAEILALSRLDGAARHLELMAIDLVELVDRVAADAAFEGAARQQAVLWSPPPAAVCVRGHEYWLGSALENIVRNALRYGPPGLPVEISLAPSADAICLRVRDHGEGVSEGELASLFQPFYRTAASRELQPAGTGLGLALVARIAALHGGNCRASNADDGGLVVELILPAMSPDRA